MRWVLSGVFSFPPLGFVGAPILPPVRPPPNGLPVVVDMEGSLRERCVEVLGEGWSDEQSDHDQILRY